jgi:hypothetical protein
MISNKNIINLQMFAYTEISAQNNKLIQKEEGLLLIILFKTTVVLMARFWTFISCLYLYIYFINLIDGVLSVTYEKIIVSAFNIYILLQIWNFVSTLIHLN